MNNEPLTFWVSGIDFNSFKLRPNSVVTAFLTPVDPGKAEAIQVIRKSDYDDLKVINSELSEVLKFYANGNHYSCYCFDENLDSDDQLRHKHQWDIEDGQMARDILTKHGIER